MKKIVSKFIVLIIIILIYSCGYSFQSLKNKWQKDGINTVSVPMFLNDTIEGGSEVYFTNSLRLYMMSRSGKLKLVRSNGDAKLIGIVKNIKTKMAGVKFGSEETQAQGGVPAGRMLAITYNVYVTVDLKMVRNKDNRVLWSKTFTQVKNMDSGSYTDFRKSSNVLIKEGAKRESIRLLADSMMLFAVDSLLEEF